MSSVRTPQEKKRPAYQRDHYAKGKHDKGFRRVWPLKKRKASRAFRHAADTMTKTALLASESDVGIRAIKPKPLRKWAVKNLREFVAGKVDRRVCGVNLKKTRRRMRDQRGS
jgi:hypothetical protein